MRYGAAGHEVMSGPRLFYVECVKCGRRAPCMATKTSAVFRPSWVYQGPLSTRGVCDNCLVLIHVEVMRDLVESMSPDDRRDVPAAEIYSMSYKIARAQCGALIKEEMEFDE